MASTSSASESKRSSSFNLGSAAMSSSRIHAADLKNKTCWICSEDEDEDAAAVEAALVPGNLASSTQSAGMKATRRFVHACGCTLVAHEACLLAWIEQVRTNPNPRTGSAVTCPQCKVPYKLYEPKPWALRILEVIDGVVEWAVPYTGAGMVLGTVVFASTIYGCVAIRLFMGKEAASIALSQPWPWHFWVDIPMVPFALIGARLRIFESASFWLPTLIAAPVVQLPVTLGQYVFSAHWYSLAQRYQGTWRALLASTRLGPQVTTRAFPPSPGSTLLLVPWFRSIYAILKKRVYARVLKKSARGSSRRRITNGQENRPRAQMQQEQRAGAAAAGEGARPDAHAADGPAAQQDEENRRPDRRVIVLGTEAAQNDYARAPDPAPGVAAVRQERVPREEQQQAPAPAPAQQRGEQRLAGHYHEDGDSDDEEGIAVEDVQDVEDDAQRRQELYDALFGAGRREAPPEGIAVGIRRQPAAAQANDGLQPEAENDNDHDHDHDHDHEAAAAGPQEDLELRVYVTPRSLAQLCIGALSLPGIAAAMGSLLKQLARHSFWLQRFLGLLPQHFAKANGWTPATGSVTSTGISPLSRIWNSLSSSARGSSKGFSGSESARSFEPIAFISPYDELEPVWWRNAVGAAIYIVVKDAAVLLYRHLKLKQKGKMRVKDIPFDPKLVSGLDLR